MIFKNFAKSINEKILLLVKDAKGYIVLNCFHEGHVTELDIQFL